MRQKKLTDKPFGVNLMLLHPQAGEMADIVVEEKVPVVTTGAGNPGIYIKKWKEAGIIVMPVVPSVALCENVWKKQVWMPLLQKELNQEDMLDN